MGETSTTRLRVVIFAGGVGTRMWPLSRKNTPKQFEKIIEDKSTLQLAVDRVLPDVGVEDIYISTGQQYTDIVKEQLPQIPQDNIIGEPEMRDVAPAVGYLMSILAKKDPWGPVAILWSDHLMQHVHLFKQALSVAAKYISKNKRCFVFLGQKPRFANQNLGWIECGEKLASLDGMEVREFRSWHYRPSLEKAKLYFENENYTWNPGYFVTAPQFVLDQFEEHEPNIHKILIEIQDSYGTSGHEKTLNKLYPKMTKISFDDAILMKVKQDKAVVLPVDFGWSDVGTWEALKEALQTSPNQNLNHGYVVTHETENSLVYNYTDSLIAAVDLKGMVVVATKDVILVTPQESIPKVKELLKTFEGTEKEKYT